MTKAIHTFTADEERAFVSNTAGFMLGRVTSLLAAPKPAPAPRKCLICRAPLAADYARSVCRGCLDARDAVKAAKRKGASKAIAVMREVAEALPEGLCTIAGCSDGVVERNLCARHLAVWHRLVGLDA